VSGVPTTRGLLLAEHGRLTLGREALRSLVSR